MTRRKLLTPAQVAEIRAKYKRGKLGYGYGSLAKEYGVGASTIRDVIHYVQRGYA
jgi:hypothetical protein